MVDGKQRLPRNLLSSFEYFHVLEMQPKNEMQEFSGLTRHQEDGFSEMQGWQETDM